MPSLSSSSIIQSSSRFQMLNLFCSSFQTTRFRRVSHLSNSSLNTGSSSWVSITLSSPCRHSPFSDIVGALWPGCRCSWGAPQLGHCRSSGSRMLPQYSQVGGLGAASGTRRRNNRLLLFLRGWAASLSSLLRSLRRNLRQNRFKRKSGLLRNSLPNFFILREPPRAFQSLAQVLEILRDPGRGTFVRCADVIGREHARSNCCRSVALSRFWPHIDEPGAPGSLQHTLCFGDEFSCLFV